MNSIIKLLVALFVISTFGVWAGFDKYVNAQLFLLLFLGHYSLTLALAKIKTISNQELSRSKLISLFFDVPDYDQAPQSPEELQKKKEQSESIRFFITLILYFLYFLFFVALGNKLYYLLYGSQFSAYDSSGITLLYLISYIILSFTGLFSLRSINSNETKKQDNKDYSVWFRALIYYSVFCTVLSGLYLFIIRQTTGTAYYSIGIKIYDYISFGMYLFLALIFIELVLLYLKALLAQFFKTELKQDSHPFILRIFFCENGIKNSFNTTITKFLGIDLSKSEALNYLKTIFEPVVIISLILVWLATSIVIVPPAKEAIFERFGAIVGKTSFKAGIYLKLPWPMTSVKLFEKHLIRTLNVGFEPDPNQKNLLWTQSHAAKTFNLITGNGLEIISLDCQVMYSISDLYAYYTSIQNPEDFLVSTTYEYLTRETIGSTFDEIMVRDRSKFSLHLKSQIQSIIDKKNMGMKIVEVNFLAIHPPIEVASGYEDVISAQIDKNTFVLNAKTEKEFKISMAQALKESRVLSSRSYAETSKATSIGKAHSFLSRSLGYIYEPELTRFRLRNEKLSNILSGKRIFVVDKSFLRKKDKLYLDMRGLER
jgi:regulator of protease activity HflC (stomatin/prohibitin superfamily)